MALTERCAPWCIQGTPELIVGKVASSQTFGGPAPVYVSSDGQVKICVDSDSASEIAIRGFVYTAVSSAASENTDIYYARITADQKWGMWVSNNGSDSAAAQSVVGDQYGHSVESSTPWLGYMTCDLNLTSYLSMYVEDIVSNRDTKIVASTSTSPGAVVVSFLPDALTTVLA